MRRMLDPKEAGGSLPSTITFDEDGNRKVGKNLGIDGKLTLKSLVSESNPDGDITKEQGKGGSGGGSEKLYCHCIEFRKYEVGFIYINYYSTRSTPYDFDSLHASWNKRMACTGVVYASDNIMALYIERLNNEIFTVGCLSKSIGISNKNLDKTFEMFDRVSPVV